MSTPCLRRTLLALAVATACPAVTHAAPAPDVTHDLSQGRFVIDRQTFNDVTLIGTITSQHTTPFDDIDVGDLQAITVLGNFTNKASINVNGDDGTGLYFDPSHSIRPSVGGDFSNEGTISVQGKDAWGVIFEQSDITGDIRNSGNIVASGEGAEGIILKDATQSGLLINTGTLHNDGLNSRGLDITGTQLNGIQNSGTLRATGVGAEAIHIEQSSFPPATPSNFDQAGIVNTGTITADGIAINVASLSGSNPFMQINQKAGLIEGGTAAIQAHDNASLNWTGGTIRGDVLGLFSANVDGNTLFDGSTLQATWIDLGQGTLTLNKAQTHFIGNLDMDSQAVLRLFLANDTNPAVPIVTVSGTTEASPGTRIQLQPRANDFRTVAQGTEYALLSSGSLVDGQNISVTSASALLNINSYGVDGNTVKAVVSSKQATSVAQNIQVAGGSHNASMAIQPFSSTVMGNLSETDEVFRAFANASTDAELAKLAETLSPELNQGAVHAATNSQTLVNNVIASRASASRNGLSSGDELAHKGVWIQALNSDANQDVRNGVDGYSANSHGIAVGIDGQFSRDTTLGLAYSYLDSDVKATGGNKTESTGHALTAYGNWTHDNWFVDTSATLGWNDNTSKRYIAATQAKADYDSRIFGLNALAGYSLHLDQNLVLEPQVGARYANVALDAYREKGSSAALNAGSQRYEIGELGAGMRLASSFDLGQGSLEPEAKVMAWHDLIADKASTTSTFVLGGTPFTTSGAKPARDSYELGMGATYHLGAWSVGGAYNYVAKTGFDSDTFTAKVRYEF
ncbi:outer membrane autotransporter barrel domain-containing protein [Pseudomonas asplenii]|uniref:Outer membrane autotransporter barrel domain-containing protein n=1 Tax=Pseudomonas asplenii TaxID=53407 RepID=A0A1H6P6G6_9PSED|nr:autotransporter outer membrane beta-barrel domain-containing protein [Pseudomonas fuscovaginae]SEI25077.1 outer membrane autotransporter barrel domain-containing protein [Pseudomonas fuscovaginae]